MRPILLIGPEQEAQAAELVAFAARADRVWHSETATPENSPGRDPRHVLILGIRDEFKCTYSVTEANGRLFRHLSIVLRTPDGRRWRPDVPTADQLARLFGFVGPITEWIILPACADPGCPCVGLLQPLDAVDRTVS